MKKLALSLAIAGCSFGSVYAEQTQTTVTTTTIKGDRVGPITVSGSSVSADCTPSPNTCVEVTTTTTTTTSNGFNQIGDPTVFKTFNIDGTVEHIFTGGFRAPLMTTELSSEYTICELSLLNLEQIQ